MKSVLNFIFRSVIRQVKDRGQHQGSDDKYLQEQKNNRFCFILYKTADNLFFFWK